MNKYIVSVDSPDFFKSPFEANRPYFESHGLKKIGGVQRLGDPEPYFKNGEPVGPARYDTRLDCRAPEHFQDSGSTGTSTPRGGTVALTPRQHENRVEKTVSKKRDKYEGKLNELRHMQRQLVEQERQLTSKLSKTYRSSSANGAAGSRNQRSHGSGGGSRGSSNAKSGSSGGAASGKRLAPRARSTRR